MIRWPAKAGQAIAKLFSSIQDIDVFVEDQDDEQFYLTLLRTAADGKLEIKRVVGLGGREAVVRAAAEYENTRRALFVIDGDLSFVAGEEAPDIPRLFRLDCYCVENLIVHEATVVELCAEECACEPSQAAEKIDFGAWLGEVGVLVPLFARFAVLRQVAPEVATVSCVFGSVVEADSRGLPQCCAVKVNRLIGELDERIDSLVGRPERESRIAQVLRRASKLPSQTYIVSGKAALLPLLHFHVKRASGTRITKESFRYRLAIKAKRSELQQLVAALEVAA